MGRAKRRLGFFLPSVPRELSITFSPASARFLLPLPDPIPAEETFFVFDSVDVIIYLKYSLILNACVRLVPNAQTVKNSREPP